MAVEYINALSMGHALRVAASTPGEVSIIGKGKLGKTRLAEALVSEALRYHSDVPYSPALQAEVVDAAARTWLAPAALRTAHIGGLISQDACDDWARDALVALNLNSEGSVKAVLSLCKDIKFSALKAKAALMAWERPNSSIRVFTLGFDEDNSDYNHDVYLQLANADALPGVDMMLKVDSDGGLEVVQVPKGLKPATEIAVEFSGLDKVEGHWLEGNVISGEPNAICVGVSITAPSNALMEEDPDAIDWQKDLFSDDDLDKPSHYVKFTNDSVSLHITTNGELTHELESIDQTEFCSSALNSVQSGSSRHDHATVNDIIADRPLDAYELLLMFGVVSKVVNTDARAAARLGRELQNLAVMLEMTNNPVLIETEDKATDMYGAISRSASLEDRCTAIELSTESSVIAFGVEESLMTTVIGAILLNPVIHVSVLDLTMVYDLAIKSTTRKGGLDSSQLNIMQHISGVARRSGATVFAETRDDFFGNDATREEEIGARDTLGANSRIAIHITEDIGDEDARSLWMRVKGYDDFEDAEYEASGVKLEHYPGSVIRSHGTLPRFLDRILEVKEWISSSVRRLFKR